jgi:hypothetical protein
MQSTGNTVTVPKPFHAAIRSSSVQTRNRLPRSLSNNGKMDKTVSAHEDFTRSLEEKAPSDRSFGLVFTGFFALSAVLPLLRGRPMRVWALVVSGGFLLITFVRPTLFSGANRLWMKLAFLLSRIVNPLVIGLLFFLVLAPMGFLLRLFGKDPLKLKPENRSSYWIARNPPGPTPSTMSNQY